MIGMQYKVILPKDYDMGIIRNRVQENGTKTDGFNGLNFKAYLITEAGENGQLYNSYAPFYIWNNHEGMNTFLFDGYYDNILDSFGSQHIQIGVPLILDLEPNFSRSQYVVEYAGRIAETSSLADHTFLEVANVEGYGECLGDVVVYNPDKWSYSHFRFYEEKPDVEDSEHLTVYEILHISR
ncbi:DUF4865 family protein [Rossellomorea marisflavi]|uniref:DUF4865 family protein n=1 Tax=Rossellomorea marisflavi TaxID=189381 RepID=UPI00296E7D6B|nr:DUF4865 family protein [Rossellomorea marisflavi]MDW4525389.1 DUF4865 family protein [Rossellomorea marisflavi]